LSEVLSRKSLSVPVTNGPEVQAVKPAKPNKANVLKAKSTGRFTQRNSTIGK